MTTQKAQAKGEVIKLSEVFGGGYDEFLHDRHFFRVVKGGRGSKKSTTAFTEAPLRIMKYPGSNILVVRQTGNTHETSTFAEVQKGVKRLHAEKYWKFTTNPCEATYKPTGQKILFRGFDDPYKLTSLNVPVGVICWIYLEEAYEMDDQDAFLTLCEGLRGKEIEELGLWPQVTLTYNPWINSHWTKTMFWDVDRPDTFRLTTTHKCNEWLTEADHARIEALNIKEIDGQPNPVYDPERYLVVGLGEYGIPGGAYFDEFRKDIHVIDPFPIPDDWRRYVTLDYGLDMLACYWIAVDWHNKAYVYREVYKSGLVISDAAKLLKEMNGNDRIYTYSAPPDLWNRQRETGMSTAEIFMQNGIPLVKAANNRVQGWYNLKEWLKPYKNEQGITTAPLTFFKNCVNIIRCLPQVQCDEKDPNDVANEPHELTHSVDAVRYWTASRPRGGKEAEKEKFPVNSLEYRVQKNLDRLTKKRRVETW